MHHELDQFDMSNEPRTINCIEFLLRDAEATKRFYASVFGREFPERGPNCLSFSVAGIDGGFYGEDKTPVQMPGVDVVSLPDDHEASLTEVKEAGAIIVRDIYPFPGGRRFQFSDPNRKELAICAAAQQWRQEAPDVEQRMPDLSELGF